jgi:nuclear pore complex protein Nup98-Nup96
MSTFGGFGGGGFGSNQNQTSSSFGGFGSTTTAGGFGSTSGFGSGSNTGGGGLFGGGGGAAGAGGGTSGSTFGKKLDSTSNTSQGANASARKGGFGSNPTSSPFGQNKPAFGSTSTSGGGLFGGGTATSGSGFGGFGQSQSSTGGFGGTPAAGFGANKPAFGGSSGTGLFAGGSTGFGSSTPASNTAFGSGSPFGGGQNNGTGSAPFAPHIEKEPNSTGSNAYQSISAIPAYQKFSLEELRLVDYTQGRKYGNQSGQAGAFGASTGFGGFGSSTAVPAGNTGFGGSSTTGGGLFGSGSTSTPFGGGATAAQSTAAGGFGSSTTGGLFGQKPASAGLFGSTAATSAPSGGGLFGTSGATGGFGGGTPGTGFGASSTTGFGQTQNKPFGGFGSSTAGGFGGGATTGGGLFGGGSSSTPFGQSTQPGTSGGLFGQQNQQQQQQQQQQQGQTGAGLFGGFGQQNQQQKPGLFGSTTSTAGAGLFGQQQPAQQQSGGLFGGSATQQSGGLFGQKPAATSLFGGSTAGSGGGLFGGTQQQQPAQGTGLFGSNTQQIGGLFGNKPAALGGTSLFGQSQPQQQSGGTGLFGGNQQPQQQGLSSSLFSSTQQQPHQVQSNHLLATLTESPYGNAQLFAGLQSPSQSLGPLATPLSSAQKSKKQAVIPHHRIMPHASSRLITPQKRPGGYGFSYSAYNSPASVSSNASPVGLGGSLLSAGSISRSLGKSLSTSNLRHSFTAQESILAPGAFSNVSRSGPGSMKKLNINRNLTTRRSLFGTESQGTLSKRVSFENGDVQSNGTSPTNMSGALVRTEDTESTISDSVTSPQVQSNGLIGKELAVVPEAESPESQPSNLEMENRKARLAQKDQTPGGYRTEPSIAEIQAMPREERSKIKDFIVSREGVGKIVFSQVDLTTIPLEQICGQIVELELRRATVYGDHSPVKTPTQGQGLNVPSRITLENSWPRARHGRLKVPERSGQAFEKHIRLLKACKDTRYISYEHDTGRWTFEVDHYTTYGLDYDDDESVMDSTMLDNTFTGTDNHGIPAGFNQQTPLVQVGSSNVSSTGSLDDTFDFKRGKRVVLPGQFDEDQFEDDLIMAEEDNSADHLRFQQNDPQNATVFKENIQEGDEFMEDQKAINEEDPSLPLAVSGPVKLPSEVDSDASVINEATPAKIERLVLESNWTEQLLQTASPKKRDRQVLREKQNISPPGFNVSERKPLEMNKSAAFGTTVDIMKSLWASPKDRENGLEVRY